MYLSDYIAEEGDVPYSFVEREDIKSELSDEGLPECHEGANNPKCLLAWWKKTRYKL